ncbi:MAG: tetratricopeptide repeat protein, partial [Anaerolineaceae bacterium]
MATISLRAYNHEIEEMIAHNQFDQAIAHCRNILKSYPKHIDTYRLLGKAFLENQRYGDAGDIFQRVLSSFPEDFISHVGMSIIREDEGNLDDALWHMERAFELQPSNNAVQGELRRLHGKREGVEPSKIRLTRGALAHMYIRGDLFPQAIAELKIALTEDPTRFDLQTSLAKAYYLSGQLAEAAKISNEIINKLPYSFEANRILAEVYKKSDRKEEAQPYLEKLFELDPYFAYVTDNIQTPEQVNEEAVTLEKLERQPGSPMPVSSSQPAWAAS